MRWTALASALQLILITAVAHSDPKPRSQPRGPQGCNPANVALFQAPTPSCGSNLQAMVGEQFTLSVTAGDADSGDVVQLGIVGLPAGAKLSTPLPASGNPVSTNLTWTPAAGDTGMHVITFTATDGCAKGPTSCSFTVHVHAAGSCSSTNVALFQAPTPSCGSALSATVGTPFTLSVHAGDADAGDVVQLGVIGLPSGAILSTPLPASGNPVETNLTWTPAAGDTGAHVITFTAYDGCAKGPTQCSFTVNVSSSGGGCSSTNVALFQAPTPSCGSALSATVGTPFTLSVNAADADSGDVVQLGVIGLPSGATLSTPLPASGNPVSTNLTWTPAAGDTGSHVITFTAFDGCASGPTSCSFTVNVGSSGGVGCSPTNVALFQSPTPNCGSTQPATVGTPVTFTVQAGDADKGDIVQLGVIGLPAGAQLSTPLPASGNPVSTNFTWTPTAADTGSHVITFTAFDSCAAGPTQCSITIEVAGNIPPSCSGAFASSSEIWPPNGRMVPVHIEGINDPDGDSFTVQITNVTSDEAIGSGDASCDGNGNVSVRARRDGGGNGRVYHVSFVATDVNGASCEGSVELCVPHDQGRNSQCVDDGQGFRVQTACTDDDARGAGGTAASALKKDELDLKVRQVAAGVAQVDYMLPAEAQVSLSVYNVAGRRIATILEGRQPAGANSAQWTPANRVPGVYFVQLRTADKSIARRIFFVNR